MEVTPPMERPALVGVGASRRRVSMSVVIDLMEVVLRVLHLLLALFIDAVSWLQSFMVFSAVDSVMVLLLYCCQWNYFLGKNSVSQRNCRVRYCDNN